MDVVVSPDAIRQSRPRTRAVFELDPARSTRRACTVRPTIGAPLEAGDQ